MYSLDKFKTVWQERHTPTMDLGGDAEFYYGVYHDLYSIAGKSARFLRDDVIISLTMYIENKTAIGLDSQYERMYRSIDDLVRHWCNILYISEEDYRQISEYAAKAVAAAPQGSSLRRWVTDNILANDFNRLKDVAMFFGQQDLTLNIIYPPLDFRAGIYKELTKGDEKSAWQMLWSNFAFNWRDKTGMTVLRRLAMLLDKSDDERKAAANLQSVSSKRLDAYLPKDNGNSNILTLINNEGQVFNDVIFSTPLPQASMSLCFIGQLVTYLGKIYVNGAGVWYDRDAFDRWDGNMLWNEIDAEEKENSKDIIILTLFGENISAYEDLYGLANLNTRR